MSSTPSDGSSPLILIRHTLCRGMGTGLQRAPANGQAERSFPATFPAFGAAQPALRQAARHGMASVAPDLAALPHATWPQPTPWPAQRYPVHPSAEARSAAASPPGQPTDRHSAYPPQECQPETRLTRQPADRHTIRAPHEYQPATAAGTVHELTGRAASLSDKTTQCPEGVDRQTQTESPEPDRLPASRCKHPTITILFVTLPASGSRHRKLSCRGLASLRSFLHAASVRPQFCP